MEQEIGGLVERPPGVVELELELSVEQLQNGASLRVLGHQLELFSQL